MSVTYYCKKKKHMGIEEGWKRRTKGERTRREGERGSVLRE